MNGRRISLSLSFPPFPNTCILEPLRVLILASESFVFVNEDQFFFFFFLDVGLVRVLYCKPGSFLGGISVLISFTWRRIGGKAGNKT